jgi:hypothetical protein
MTALPPPVSELEAILGVELDGVDRTRAERALNAATTLALVEVPTRTAQTWAQGAAPEVVELVIVTAARRGYENPRGILTESLGEHSVSLSESTGVYLTRREVELIERAAKRRRVYSIRTPSAYEAPADELGDLS